MVVKKPTINNNTAQKVKNIDFKNSFNAFFLPLFIYKTPLKVVLSEKAKFKRGEVMMVHKIHNTKLKVTVKKTAFFFPESESLTKAILFLMKTPECKQCCSSLYKINGKYVLLTEKPSFSATNVLNEFCLKKSNNPILLEHVKEYGKPLIINNAIMRYGVAFSKRSQSI